MNDKSDKSSTSSLTDSLKHVRFIHFSLLLVSGTLLYVASTASLDLKRIEIETAQLKEDVEKLKSIADCPHYLYYFGPAHAERYERRFQNMVKSKLTACSPGDVYFQYTEPGIRVFRVSLARDSKLDETASFGEVFRQMGNYMLSASRIDTVTAPWQEINRWLEDQIAVASSKDRAVRIILESVDTKLSSQHGHLGVELCRKAGGAVPYRAHFDSLQKRRFPAEWITSGQDIGAVSPDYFFPYYYPTVWKYWNSLHTYSITTNQHKLISDIAKQVTEATPSLFGLRIDGRHAVRVAFVVIMSQLVYLLLHLHAISAASTPSEISPSDRTCWIGLMQNGLTRTILLMTFLLPPSSVAYAVRTLIGGNWFWTILIFVFVAVFAMLCFRKTMTLWGN